MKNQNSIWYRIGRTLKRAIKNYVRGMPEEKVYIRPSRSKYVQIPKQEKSTAGRKYVKRRKKTIARKERMGE